MVRFSSGASPCKVISTTWRDLSSRPAKRCATVSLRAAASKGVGSRARATQLAVESSPQDGAPCSSRAFRLAVLQTHYRKAMELGDTELESAASGIARIDALVRRSEAAGVAWQGNETDESTRAAFIAALEDDFGTPGAVAAIFDAVAAANVAIDSDDTPRAAGLVASVVELAGVLGLVVEQASSGDVQIDTLVAKRDAARARRDFAAADEIRDELARRGVTLEDGTGTTTWHRA